MDRYDQLMQRLTVGLDRIAAAEADISASANRVLAELSTSLQQPIRPHLVERHSRNTERMLATLISFSGGCLPSTSASNTSSSSSFNASGRSMLVPEDGRPAEDQVPRCDSIVDFQSRVQQKCQQIKNAGMMVSIINETVQREISS